MFPNIFNESNIEYEASPLFNFYQDSEQYKSSFCNFNPLGNSEEDKESFFGYFSNKNQKKENLENLEEFFKNEIKEIEQRNKEEEKKNEILNFNIFTDLNIKSENISKEELLNDVQNDKKIKNEENISDKTTNFKTKETKNTIKKCIFGTNSQIKIEPRIDYAIKNIKVFISKFLKEYGNQLIEDCDFKDKMKKLKLFAPSYKYFTGNSNEKDNKIFLNFTVEQIFSYDKSKKDKSLQQKNKDTIKKISNYIENIYTEKVPQSIEKLQNFFKMTFEDIIVLFYNSQIFKDYISDPKTIFLDQQFTKTKGFSLLEKNGLIKLLKN